MKKNYKIYFYIAGIFVALLIIFLILFNTLFYNYKDKLNNYLATYYSLEENNIDDVNKMIERYKNNTNRTITINNVMNDDLNERVDNYNISYENIDSLTNTKDKLINKVTFLLDNLKNNLEVINRKESILNTINILFESKSYYLSGLECYNKNDYNCAYDNFKNVVKQDFYFEDTSNKIDNMFNSEISLIDNHVKEEYAKVLVDTIDSDRLEIYKNILNYLIDKRNNVTFDLTKSKLFNSMTNDIQAKLTETYLNIAKTLADDNKYNDAIVILNEGINLINKASLDATKLILTKEEYDKMQPVSLTTLKGEITGSSIKEEMAIDDIKKDNYSKALTFYKVDNSAIVYDLNQEYKWLSFVINLGKDVTVKNSNYGRIRILTDDKKIYDSSDLNVNFKKKEVKLDVNNIKSLKIEYNISNSKSINQENIFVALLGNPTLEKY